MSVQTTLRAAATGLMLTIVAACASSDDQQNLYSEGFTRVRAALTPQTPPASPTTESVLATTTGPLMRVVVENRGVSTFLFPIETNGAYVTWGASDRRSLTLKRGMLTGSRGLGEDLMSSGADASLALITARRSGSAQRIQRYLTPDNRSYEIVAACNIAPDGTQGVGAGVIRMTEVCQAPEHRFTNTYLVDGAGRILDARQWVSPQNDYLRLTLVRG